MKNYEIIIKNNNGEVVTDQILAKTFSKNEITIISPIIDESKDTEYTVGICKFIQDRFKEFGLKDFIVMPVKDKDHTIQVQKVNIKD